MKLVFVGGGTMAEAMIQRLIAGGTVTPAEVSVVDISRARRELLKRQHDVATYEAPAECICGSDVVVLAVKPQELAKVAPQVGKLEEGQLLLSILAGTQAWNGWCRSSGTRSSCAPCPTLRPRSAWA